MMKTKAILFLSAVALLLTLTPAVTNAQFSKGDLLVEGGLGNIKVLLKQKDQYETAGFPGADKYESKGFSIAVFPRVGFFVTKSLVIGTTLGINYSSAKSKRLFSTGQTINDQKSSQLLLDFLPFVRYYFAGNAKTHFYGQVDGGISVALAEKNEGKSYDSFGTTVSSYKTDYDKKPLGFSAEALVGVNHFVSQNVAINAALGYNYSQSTMTSHTVETPPFFTYDPQKHTVKAGAIVWNVGFTMIIPCKKKK